MIQYQIISKYSLWGTDTAKKKLEKAINEAVKKGWRVVLFLLLIILAFMLLRTRC